MVKRLTVYPLLATLVVLTLWAIAATVTWRPEPLTPEEAFYAKISDPTLKIVIKGTGYKGHGSGVVIAREGKVYFVQTARHVVGDKNAKFYVEQLGIYGRIEAQVFKQHPVKDIAIIVFVSEREFPVAEFAPESPVTATTVYLCGYGRRGAIPKVTRGILSMKDSEWTDAPWMWVVSAQVWYGDSGCGCWNEKGQLIGMATLMKSEGFLTPLPWQCGIISLDDIKEFLEKFGFGLAKDEASSVIKHEDEAGYFYPVRLWPEVVK